MRPGFDIARRQGWQSGLALFLIVLAFRILLDAAYAVLIQPVWNYTGFELEIHAFKLLESYLLLGLVFLTVPRGMDKLSDCVLQIFFLTSYTPLLSYYAMTDAERGWVFFVTAFWLLACGLNRFSPDLRLAPVRNGRWANTAIAATLIAYSILMIGVYLGFNINFDLTTVYETREIFRDKNIPLAGYLINWTSRIIAPYMILIGLYGRKKSRLLFWGGVVLGLLLFSGTGQKSYFFSIPVTIGLAWMLKQGRFYWRTALGMTLMVLLGFALYLGFQDILFSSFLLRRAFYVPVEISFYYFDFFSGHPLYLSHSFLSPFFHYPYDYSPPRLIAMKYLYFVDANANTGLVSDGYMNFGTAALALWVPFFVLLLKAADAVTLGKEKAILWPLFILSFYSMVNSALFTVFLTHGMFLVLLVGLFTERIRNHADAPSLRAPAGLVGS